MWMLIALDAAAEQIKRGWDVGPFHFSNEVSIGTLVLLFTVIAALIKFIVHTNRVEDQVDQMWRAFIGDGPMDEKSLINQFHDIRWKVNEIWTRLGFNNIERKKLQ